MRTTFLSKALVVLLAALALAPAAQADGVDGGSAHMKLARGLAKTLRHEGIRLVRLGPAKANNASITLPIFSGLLDSQQGSGSLSLAGGFKLRAGKRTVTVRQLVLDTAQGALRAKLGGRAMKLADDAPQRVGFRGFDLGLTLKSLALTPRATAVLNRKLGLDGVFEPGGSLGSLDATAEFETLTVRGGELTLALDPRFQEKLQSLDVRAEPAYSATLLSASPTAISMAVEAGQISPDLSLGALIGKGGLRLFQPDENQFGEPFERSISCLYTDVALDSHRVSCPANVQTLYAQPPPFSGAVSSFPAAGAAVEADPISGEIGVLPLPLALDQELAGAMNSLFGAPKGHPDSFSAGEIFATFAFRVRTR
jgi:hypothetical protein